MNRLTHCGWLTLSLGLILVPIIAFAAPTPAQKKELGEIVDEIGKVRSLITKKKHDDAEKALSEAEGKLEQLAKDAQFPENDPQLRKARTLLETQRNALAKAKGGKGGPAPGVSFVKDVAPILNDHCLRCHGENSQNGLRLDSYAAMERGGRSGALVQARAPGNSLLMQRLIHPDPMRRMPRGAEPLSQKEIQTIAAWITAGAEFDGQEKTVALSLLAKNPEAAAVKIEIAKPTGNETVSFIRDVAPTFVTTCGNCHGANNPRGGLSLVNFERVMAGGESGRIVVPGKVDESKLFQVLRDGEMPQGNMARITKKWYADLQTWIREGAKFDGKDPKTPLRDLIPSEDQLKAEELAKLSPDQWVEKRHADALALWKQSFPQAGEPQTVSTAEFLVAGDASTNRLKEVGDWAQEYAATLRTMFNAKEEPLWKGKLTIFVFKDRFGYEEFNSTIYRRDVPREVTGHSDVTFGQDRALTAVQDVGDDISSDSPGLQLNVIEQVTSAFLKRGGESLPDWLARGAGLALAAGKSSGGNAYIGTLKGRAVDVLRTSNITNPADVFANGQFSPADVGPVGYSIVDFLLKQGGAPKFGQLVRRLQAGDAPDAALRAAYNTDPRVLGTAYVQSLGGVTPKSKSKK